MTLFDRYIAVDWSAANEPRSGADSIWIAELTPAGPKLSVNPRTRHEAMEWVKTRIADARTAGERVLAGFDFAFGYPRGAARAIAGKSGWQALWTTIADAVKDDENNRSNRFEVAAEFNLTLDQHHFWGHPPHHSYADLKPTRPAHGYPYIGERRIAEAQAGSAQPVWKLSGAGSVGSQSLLGIARLAALRRDLPEIAVWPFETDFDKTLRPVTIAEIYPSLFPLSGRVAPRDREQVETVVQHFATLDAAGRLGTFLSAPHGLSVEQRRIAVEEEGWILGVGHELLIADARVKSARFYLRDPEAIYAQSFRTIREEADLKGLDAGLHDVAIRMIHASGLIEITKDIRASADLVEAGRRALKRGAAILCDCEMVRSGTTQRNLHGNELVVTLNDTRAPELAKELGTTRSAAAVELWRDTLDGAIVVIGNAPTALFHLLEMLEDGAPKPAAIIATPVGFVGAAEAKAELALGIHGVPFITVLGRIGGSAMASAALNAIAKAIA